MSAIHIDLEPWKKKHPRMSKWHPEWFVDYNKEGFYKSQTKHTYSWTATWILVLQRDKSICRVCGSNGKGQEILDKDGDERRCGIEVQHIIPRSQGGADHPANLITLCRECHLLTYKNNYEGIPGITFEVKPIEQVLFDPDKGEISDKKRTVKVIAYPIE